MRRTIGEAIEERTEDLLEQIERNDKENRGMQDALDRLTKLRKKLGKRVDLPFEPFIDLYELDF